MRQGTMASATTNIANVEIERISKGGFYKLGRVDFDDYFAK
jgi:hypothetical protein